MTHNFREQFPIFSNQQSKGPFAYLDSAATTQQPSPVIEATKAYYENTHANVHRGLYRIAQTATDAFEQTRASVAQWINAPDAHQIIFTKGATEAINMVADSYLKPMLNPGDEVLITGMEHHANIIPWQQCCLSTGAVLKVVPFEEDGSVDLEQLDQYLTSKTKLFAFVHISNTLGTINPISEFTNRAHQYGVPVLIDATQSMVSSPVDVSEVGCDFLVASGHKMFGPTGTGFLYGRKERLEEMTPYQYGGEMIRRVTFERTTFAPLPHRLEAGTPNIAGVIGLGAAIEFLESLDKAEVHQHLSHLLSYAQEKLQRVTSIKKFGTTTSKSGIISFNLGQTHAHDLATFLDDYGVCMRAGHHCTQPIMQFYGVPAMMRMSFSIYNSTADIDHAVGALQKATVFFG